MFRNQRHTRVLPCYFEVYKRKLPQAIDNKRLSTFKKRIVKHSAEGGRGGESPVGIASGDALPRPTLSGSLPSPVVLRAGPLHGSHISRVPFCDSAQDGSFFVGSYFRAAFIGVSR
jgi:hypothetical protein